MREWLSLLSWITASALLPVQVAAQQASDFHLVDHGRRVGEHGVQVAHDARGPAIVATGDGYRFWLVLRGDGHGGYVQDFVSPIAADQYEAYTCVRCADVLPAAGPEVVVTRSDGYVEIWQLQTGTRLRRFACGLTPSAVAAADLDGDGSIELVVTGSSSTRVLHVDGSLVAALPGIGGEDVTIGQMDGDAALEFATTSGHVVDGASLSVQWTWAPGFGIDVEVADVDGDGRDELLAGEFVQWVWCYDVDLQLPKYALPAHPPGGGNLGRIAVGNLDADPAPEIVVGDQQRGVTVFDGATQAVEQSLVNDDGQVTGLAVGDSDNDGVMEIVFGTEHGSAKAHLVVVDAMSGVVDWRSAEYDAPFFGPFLGDFDGDQHDDLVVVTASHAAAYQAPRVLVFDPVSFALRQQSSPLSRSYVVSSAAAADLDGDGDLELVVCNGAAEILDWHNGAPVSQTRLTVGGVLVAAADVDGDHHPDLLIGQSTSVGAYSLPNGSPLWSRPTPFRIRRLAVADVDFDGHAELLVSGDRTAAVVLDLATGGVEATFAGSFTAADAAELLPGVGPLVLGDGQGRLTVELPAATGYQALGPVPLRHRGIVRAGFLPGTDWPLLTAEDGITLHSGLAPVWQSFAVGNSPIPAFHWPTLTLFVCSEVGCFGFHPR